MLKRPNRMSLLIRFLFIVGLLVGASLAVAACGANDNDQAAGTTPVAGATAPAETLPATEPADQATATPSLAEATPVATEAVVEPTGTLTDTTAMPASDAFAMRASELMGANVTNAAGEDLGEIKDFIVSEDNNGLNYAVISFGGLAGIGDKLYAIPVSAMNFNSDNDAFVFDVTEETLQKAPGFDDNGWPDLANGSWDDQVLSFWQSSSSEVTLMPETGATGTTGTGPAAVRASQLIGDNVTDATGKDIGEVEDMLVSLDRSSDDQRNNYAVLSFGGIADLGEKNFVVPLNHLTVDTGKDDLVIFNVDQATLQNAPSIEQDNWPDMNDPTWDDNIASFWQANPPAAAPGAGAGAVEDNTTGDTMAALEEGAIRASEMMGYTVKNSQGEDVGEIKDLLVGLNSNRIYYAIVSFGGITDILSNNLYAIPLNALNFASLQSDKAFTIDETTLQTAPYFDADAWPDLTDPNWDNETNRYWHDRGAITPVDNTNPPGPAAGSIDSTTEGNEEPGREAGSIDSTPAPTPQPGSAAGSVDNNAAGTGDTTAEAGTEDNTADAAVTAGIDEPVVRASDLIGYNVINPAGEDLGDIKDLMVGLDSQQIRYAVLSFGGFLNMGDKLFAIPLNAMQLNPDQKALVLDVDQATLENAPGFSQDNWPDTASPQWDLENRNYWDNTSGASTVQ